MLTLVVTAPSPNARHLEMTITHRLSTTLKTEDLCRCRRWYNKEPSQLGPWALSIGLSCGTLPTAGDVLV